MYRARMEKDAEDITLDYVSSMDEDAEIAGYDITASMAHVVMLHSQEIIGRDDAAAILCALEGIDPSVIGKDGSEDIHEAIEAAVTREAGAESGGRMHTARSRNDQVAADIRMKVRDDINSICAGLADATKSLLELAGSHTRTVMPLYTHLQHAQTGTFSHYLLAHADALFRDIERFYSAYERVNLSPLGAGPVGGTSIGIDREVVARMLGFEGIIENSLDATSCRDFAAEYVGAAAIMMTNLSRLAEDIVLWSSTEFGFVELADGFASPSSVMPQKKNPDIMELARGKAAEIIGCQTAVLSIIKGLATGYGRDLQQLKPQIWRTSRTAVSALRVASSALCTISVNKKRMREAADGGYLEALDVAESLVRKGTAFRTAHGIVGSLVRELHSSGRALRDATPEDAAAAVSGTDTSPDFLLEMACATTPESSLDARISKGSSGYAEQERMIKSRAEKADSYVSDIARRRARIENALGSLQDAVKKITG